MRDADATRLCVFLLGKQKRETHQAEDLVKLVELAFDP
jgi:hypothetical protein